MLDKIEKVIYLPGETNLQTVVYKDSNGVERCAYSGTSLESNDNLTVPEYLEKNKDKGFIVISFDEALDQMEQNQNEKYVTGWKEITEEQWTDALNVLPPEKWKTVNGVELFRMSERLTSNITGHYAQYKGRYFCANRRTHDSYETLAMEIKTVERRD